MKPPLVHFSPLPTMRNGIADYAAAILERLTGRYDCICVLEDPDMISEHLANQVQVISLRDYALSKRELASYRHLAHLGNNKDHIGIISALQDRSATVVLHDPTLLYLLEHWAQVTLGEPGAIVPVIRTLSGGQPARLLKAKLSDGVSLSSAYREVDCLQVLKQIARSVITHSDHGQTLVRAAGFEGTVRVLTHFADLPNPEQVATRRRAWRRQFGIRPDTFLMSSIGFVTVSKRIDLVLECLANLPSSVGNWVYLVAGEMRTPGLIAIRDRLGLHGRVIFVDYLSPETLNDVLAASDLLINLRFPTSGETSGTVCRGFGVGLPAIVSDHGWYSELPDDAVWHITPIPGPTAQADLYTVLLTCLLDRNILAKKGKGARLYAEQNMSLDKISENFSRAIEEDQGMLRQEPKQVIQTTVLSQPIARTNDSFDAEGTLKDHLLQALEDERVTADGYPCPLSEWPGAFSPLILEPSLEKRPVDPTEPCQIVTVCQHGHGQNIFDLITDIGQNMKNGDYLTVAVFFNRPLRPGAPENSHIYSSDSEFSLPGYLSFLLQEVGFETIRARHRYLNGRTLDNSYAALALATARKVGSHSRSDNYRKIKITV